MGIDYKLHRKEKMRAPNLMLTLTFTLFLVSSSMGEICYYTHDDGYSYIYEYSLYCDNGCCGYYSSRRCCAIMTLGGLVATILGSLLSLSLFIAIIICVICICRKKGGNQGTVLQQGEQQIVTTHQVTGGQHLPFNQQQYQGNPGFSQ